MNNKLITIKDFLELVEYKISESSEFLWKCYGKDAMSMDYWNDSHDDSISICVVFDKKTSGVYEMQAWDGVNNREYRWTHPDYIKARKKESKSRGLKHRTSIDDRKFIDLETTDDILKKSRAMFLGEKYDTRVDVPIDLPDDVMFAAMKAAHEADMTFNNYIAGILQNVVDASGIKDASN